MTVIASDAPTSPVVNVGTLARQWHAAASSSRSGCRPICTRCTGVAADEFRSVNAQIETVLLDAARRAGRLGRGADRRGRATADDDGPAD